MVLKKSTGQFTLAAGTPITTSTAGSPDAFSTVVPAAGAITSEDRSGKEVIQVVADPAAATYFGWTSMDAAAVSGRGRFIVKTPSAWPAAGRAFVNVRTNGGGTALVSIGWDTTGKIFINSDVSSAQVVASTGLSLGTEYDIAFRFRNATGTTTDTAVLEARLAPVSGVEQSIISGAGHNVTGQNYGAAGQSPGTVRHGKTSTSGALNTIEFSYISYETSATPFTTMLPVPVAGVPPLVTGPSTASLRGATGLEVTMHFDTSDSDGTVTDLIVTQTSGPAVTLSGTGLNDRKFTPATPGIRVFSTVAVDNEGNQSIPLTTTVPTYDASGRTQVRAMRTNPDGFTAVGGTFTGVVQVPVNTADYIISVNNPTTDVIVYDMDPAPDGPYVFNPTFDRSPSGGPATTLIVELLTGGSDTVFATSPTYSPNDTWTTPDWILSPAQLTNWTDRNFWAVRVTVNQ